MATTKKKPADEFGKVKDIPLNQLVMSELNMRHSKPDPEEDRQLKENLRQYNVLQSFIVHPGSRGKYAVAAGGRRMRLMQELSAEGEYPKTEPIPCLIVSKDDALAVSIAENRLRSNPHPVDEFRAFDSLSKIKGYTVEAIAEEFAVSETFVRQRLRLGNLHQDILQALADDKITMAQAAAFTLEQDPARQKKVFRKGGWIESYTRPAEIRSRLVSEVGLKDWRTLLVGIDAYKDAGGAVSADLFDDDARLVDVDLLDKMARELLDAIVEKEKAAGWKWVEVYEKLDFYGWQWGKAQGKDRESRSGVVIHVPTGTTGQIQIYRGLQNAADKKADKPAKGKKGKKAEAESNAYPQALIQDIGHHRKRALQLELIEHPELALELLQFTVVDDAFVTAWGSSSFVQIHPRDGYQRRSEDAIEGKQAGEPADQQFQAVLESLPLAWAAKEEDVCERFRLWRALTDEQQQSVLVAAIAVSVSIRARDERYTGGSDGLANLVCDELDIDFTQYFTPTKDNFFQRVKIPVLTEIEKTLGWHDYGTQKKKDIVKDLHQAFQQPNKPNWLPKGFK